VVDEVVLEDGLSVRERVVVCVLNFVTPGIFLVKIADKRDSRLYKRPLEYKERKYHLSAAMGSTRGSLLDAQ
jgi:hypothetical protein